MLLAGQFAGGRAEASTFTFSYRSGPWIFQEHPHDSAVVADGGGHALVGGQFSDHGGSESFVVRGNGSNWGPVIGLDGGGSDTSAYLSALTRIGPGDEWASGYFDDAFDDFHTSFFHYDGSSWSYVSPSDPLNGSPATSLSGSGANDVWAAEGTVAEHWDGTAWKAVDLPAYAHAVLDLSPTNVWAVGDGIEHWNGASWTVVPSVAGHAFEAISARSASGVWAVGDSVYQFNGTSWRAMPMPPGAAGELTSVSLLRSADIWATDGPNLFHWDGGAWTGVTLTSLVPGSSGMYLTGLSGRPDTGELWAVGNGTSPTNHPTGFVLHRAPVY